MKTCSFVFIERQVSNMTTVQILKRLPMEVLMVWSKKHLRPDQSGMEMAVHRDWLLRLNVGLILTIVLMTLGSIGVGVYVCVTYGLAHCSDGVCCTIIAFLLSVFAGVILCKAGRRSFSPLYPLIDLFWWDRPFGQFIKDGPIGFETMKVATDDMLALLAVTVIEGEDRGNLVKDYICSDTQAVARACEMLITARQQYDTMMETLKDLGLSDGLEGPSFELARKKMAGLDKKSPETPKVS